MLPNSPNVILAAQEAAKLSEKPVRVVPSRSQQAALAALVELGARRGRRDERRAARGRAGGDPRRCRGAGRPGRRRRGASSAGTRWASPRATSSPGAAPGRRCRRRSSALAEEAEIVTVIEGDGAPIPLSQLPLELPDGLELELQRGGQPNYWWLIAAQ